MRQPPKSIEAEVGLIGSCLIDGDAASLASDITPADFAKPSNGYVWKAMLSLQQRGDVLDVVSVGEELARQGHLEEVGGYACLSDFVVATPTSANASHYAESVRTKATLRRILAAASRIAEIAYADPADADEALDKAEAEIYAVARSVRKSDFAGMSSLVHDAVSKLDWIRHNKGSGRGVGSGL